MKKGNQESTDKFLRAVALPEQTDTYTVIPHGDIIDRIDAELVKRGLTVIKREYTHTLDGEIAQGKVYIECDKDPDMGMLFTWQNSYNKRVKFGCAIGGYIYDNNAPFIGTEGLAWVRLHTGTADQEAWNVIEQLLEHSQGHFESIIAEKESMRAMELDIETYGCIMGALYFEHELITPTQATAVKNERKKPSVDYTDKDTLWGLYKVLMFGIEGMDISKWQNSQQKLHHMIMAEYAITTEDTPTVTAKTVMIDYSEGGHGPIDVSTPEKMEAYLEEQDKDTPLVEETPAVIVGAESAEEEAEVRKALDEAGIGTTESLSEEVKPAGPKVIINEVNMEEEKKRFEFKDKEAFISEMSKQSSNDLAMIEYYAENHYDAEKSGQENIDAFIAYTGKDKLEPVGDTKEVIEVDEDNLVEDPIALAEEVTGTVSEEEIDAEIDDLFGEKKEETIEEVVEEITETVSNVDDSELKSLFDDSQTESKIEPVANLDKPVEIISPEESKAKVEENFLDVEEHQGTEVPADIITQAAVIEKRMTLLYGAIRPYQVEEVGNHINVTIDDTQESFYVEA